MSTHTEEILSRYLYTNILSDLLLFSELLIMSLDLLSFWF